MRKYSSDGRSSKPKGDKRSKSNTAFAELLKSTDYAHLRPASPPKINPWHRVRDTELGQQAESQSFPPLTIHQSGIPCKPPLPGAEDSDSHAPVASPPTPPSPEPQALSKSEETIETASTTSTSTSSRKLLEDAAPRVGERLWTHPFGADILVYTDSTVFQVHRNIVQPQSGWFRDNLPPPSPDGSPVAVKLPYAAGAVACCLRYTYTCRVEICEHDALHAFNIVHIPRCVLGYLAAVWLRVDKLIWQLVKTVERTAIELGDLLRTKLRDPNLNEDEAASFMIHLHNALEIAYGEPLQKLMKPMRMALASFVDTCMIFLLRQPRSAEFLDSTTWKRHSPAIWADQIEYRHLLGYSHPLMGSATPSIDAIKTLLDTHSPPRTNADVEKCSAEKVKRETSGISKHNGLSIGGDGHRARGTKGG